MTESNFGDFTKDYLKRLSKAFLESNKLGFTRPPIISATAHVPNDVLSATNELLNEFSNFLNIIVPGYWGNSCQTLSTNIFAHLNNHGIPANIIIGNVIVKGADEFETTLKSLQDEFLATERLQGNQRLHAWISLGGDTIVDAALPPRLVENYEAPQKLKDMIFILRAGAINARHKIEYQPLLVGTEFFAKTNPPDPMDLTRSKFE